MNILKISSTSSGNHDVVEPYLLKKHRKHLRRRNQAIKPANKQIRREPGEIKYIFIQKTECQELLYVKNTNMAIWVDANGFENNSFKMVSGFKQYMRRGGKVQFKRNGVMYCCFG